MSEPGVFDYPGKATAEAGQVLLDGPDGVSISLTPTAAEGTAEALLKAAVTARAQMSEVSTTDIPPRQMG